MRRLRDRKVDLFAQSHTARRSAAQTQVRLASSPCRQQTFLLGSSGEVRATGGVGRGAGRAWPSARESVFVFVNTPSYPAASLETAAFGGCTIAGFLSPLPPSCVNHGPSQPLDDVRNLPGWWAFAVFPSWGLGQLESAGTRLQAPRGVFSSIHSCSSPASCMRQEPPLFRVERWPLRPHMPRVTWEPWMDRVLSVL